MTLLLVLCPMAHSAWNLLDGCDESTPTAQMELRKFLSEASGSAHRVRFPRF